MIKILNKKFEIIVSIIIIVLTVIFKEINIIYKLESILLLNLMIFYFAFRLKSLGKNVIIFYFCCCNFLFNNGIVYIKLTEKSYFIKSMFFTNHQYFSWEVSNFIYNILYLNSIGILIGIIIIYLKKRTINNINYRKQLSNKIIIKYLEYIIIILFGYVLFNNISIFKNIINLGYKSIYLKPNIKNINYYLNVIFQILSIIYFSLKPLDSKKFKVIIFLLTINQLIISLSGSRGQLLIFLIFIFAYLEIVNVFKFKFKYLIIVFMVIALYSEFLVQMRATYGTRTDSKTINISKVKELPNKFLKSQIGTVGMIGYLKTFPEIVDGENYGKMIFSSFYNFYDSIFRKEIRNKKAEFNYEKGVRSSNFSRISYIVNYKILKEGGGLGGNYIVEMYECGKEYGVLFFSIFFIFIIYYFENILKKNRNIYLNIFSIMVLGKIFYAPRSYYFNFNIRTYLWICLIYFIMKKLIKIEVK
ncbi:MAG: O-antigen polysaccharide polymerase Wzy [Fusobacterium sp.]